jgi:hypothetical protein
MSNRKVFLAPVGYFVLLVPLAIAQDAAGDANQPSLDDVVLHQKEATPKKKQGV